MFVLFFERHGIAHKFDEDNDGTSLTVHIYHRHVKVKSIYDQLDSVVSKCRELDDDIDEYK